MSNVSSFSRQREQQLGDRHFEDRHLEMSSLPSLSTNFLGWLQQKVRATLGVPTQRRAAKAAESEFTFCLLSSVSNRTVCVCVCVQDLERLTGASRDLNTYWSHLDRKRKQMEREGVTTGHGSKPASRTPPTLPQSFSRIQREISDLVNQVNFQVGYLETKHLHPHTTRTHLNHPPHTHTHTLSSFT